MNPVVCFRLTILGRKFWILNRRRCTDSGSRGDARCRRRRTRPGQRLARHEPLTQGLECGVGLSAGRTHPLDRQKSLRDTRSGLAGIVDDDGQEKGMIISHVKRPLDGETPFAAKISFMPRFGLRRNDRHEVIAFADLLADLLIPDISAAQIAFVVPDLEAESRQRVPEHARSFAVRGGVA